MTDKPKFKNPFVEMARAAQAQRQQQMPDTDTPKTAARAKFSGSQTFNNKPTARRSGRGR